ncbi:methyltransferase [Hymenobacter sp. 5317J-9]|uniref:class I SAM-dependent methyltransferase n=1 Tax=Hymenobacter sp. 5317J-9 TaxID=2932250 RepID=UPI001FD6BAD5|nr:class I SAM-dependent methyltransferase [Hymenobacter sp. 5317J-9]UOQ95891.1 methyltransferase [Hymenobacter sp. 5317J-9]
MQDIYNDHTYLANNPTWHEEDAPFKAERILRLLRRNAVPTKTVGEVGCGSGEVLVQLATQLPNSRFTGFDISADALALASGKQTDRIGFELRDLTSTGVAEPFDLLLVIDVIEHLPNYFQFLEGIGGSGRHTVFHIPLDLSLWSLLREQMLIESKARVGHIHNFTEDFILSVLADYGFRVLDKMYTEPRYKHWSAKERLTHLLRRALYALSPRLCSKLLGGYSLLVLTENPAR